MALIALARPYIVAIYTNDVHIMPIAMYLLWFAMAYQLVDGWQVSGRLSAWHAGYTGSDVDYPDGVLGDCFSNWLVLGPLYHLGCGGCLIGLIIGLTIACVLLIGRLYLNNKRLMQLTSSIHKQQLRFSCYHEGIVDTAPHDSKSPTKLSD